MLEIELKSSWQAEFQASLYYRSKSCSAVTNNPLAYSIDHTEGQRRLDFPSTLMAIAFLVFPAYKSFRSHADQTQIVSD